MQGFPKRSVDDAKTEVQERGSHEGFTESFKDKMCIRDRSITLRAFLLKSRTGYLGWDQAKTLLMPVLSTLATMHEAGIYHLGICLLYTSLHRRLAVCF